MRYVQLTFIWYISVRSLRQTSCSSTSGHRRSGTPTGTCCRSRSASTSGCSPSNANIQVSSFPTARTILQFCPCSIHSLILKYKLLKYCDSKIDILPWWSPHVQCGWRLFRVTIVISQQCISYPTMWYDTHPTFQYSQSYGPQAYLGMNTE